MNTLLEIVDRFKQRFAQAKARLNVLDFSDLEHRTLAMLRASPDAARELRNEFEHVLVDEYQDINPVQAQILSHVSRSGDSGRKGNLFCVGDVKQSIYRFRGAEPMVFVRTLQEFTPDPDAAGGIRIDLSENFRSRPALLGAINHLMRRLMTPELGLVDYDDRASLKPGADSDVHADDGAPIELHLLTLDEAADSADAVPDETDVAGDVDLETPRSGDDCARVDLEGIEHEGRLVATLIRELRAHET
ncbi:MAG: UvrD-helicase domain-containing protein, partial [Phycisphaerae bacterium]